MAAKKILIVVVVVIMIAAIAAYFVFFRSGGAGVLGSQNASSSNTNGIQTVSVASVYPNAPTEQYLSLGTANGIVRANNFYAASSTQVGTDGVLIIKQTPDYWFTYDPSDSSFWIAISGAPFATVRAAAEQDFLATLGVSQADACKLDLSVGVPYSAGNPMNGQSLPPSFCQ